MFMMPHHNRSQRGFTLIEVLVALIVLAIGLLGVAGVQNLAMKQSSNTATRGLVTMHSYDLSERMRAEISNIGDFTKAKSQSCSGCSTKLQNWHDSVLTDVPTASTEVSVSSGANQVVANITVYWDERVLGDDAQEQSYTLTARLR